VLLALASVAPLACSSDHGNAGPATIADATPAVDLDDWVKALPTSCAFDCKNGCPGEDVGPFACPALGAWSAIPHADACGGAPRPLAAVTGKCTVAAPTGEALWMAGAAPGSPDTFVLPDGHHLTPAGRGAVLTDAEHDGGFPVSIARVPGTRFAVVVEAGFGQHLVRAIDLDKLAAGGAPIVSTVAVDRANWGVAVVPAAGGGHRVHVSGGASGKIWTISLDDATGALSLDATRTIDLGTISVAGDPAPYFSAGLAVTPDGKRLVTTGVRSIDAKVVSLDAADFGKVLATAAPGGNEQFGVAIDPADTTGELAWIAMWEDAKVVAIDTRTGEVKASVATGKNPEGIAFLDARYMVVSAADGDSLTVVDRVAKSAVASIPVDKDAAGAGTHGWSPTALAYDPASKRLFVAEAVINAVEVFDVAFKTDAPPTLSTRGRIPTAWWPTDLALDGGNLLVLEGRGFGTGSGDTKKPFGPGYGEIAESMRGTVRTIDLLGLDLSAASSKVQKNAALGASPGYPVPTCPSGAAYDFPVPKTNTEGPSKLIQHVVLVVRENKNFDSVLGDLPGVEGEPKNVLLPGKMDDLYRNFRGIGRTWAVADNYYTDAEYSSQGHVWLTYGRTTDFTERVWSIGASGKGREVGGGVTEAGRAEEGSIFEWLLREKVEQDILGEGTGLPPPPKEQRNPLDRDYPGIVQNVGLEDVTKACYFAARARARCDLHDFVYVTLPNDHTFGGGGNRPTPETMIAVNDEATGMVLEALSESPYWSSTLVIVTEDDPQDGADHVDLHRTPILFAGPWVKRGYVAKGHYDVASLIKLLAHVRGLPYPNEVVARAPLPFEVFTSTPDPKTWRTLPRTIPRACNASGSAFATEAAYWDFDDLDEQPGLGVHVRKMLRASPEARGPLLTKSP
jgi:DNA-binding beta-propeller fold protein YncE